MRSPDIRTWFDTWADVRRAFADFVAVPGATVLGFIVLSLAMYLLDRHTVLWLEPTRTLLKRHLITDPDTTNTLLGTIAGAVITVTSITFSLLLLAVQQSAAALTNQVLDQFLRRRLNQLYFGVFVGVSLYTLLALATNDTRVTPVFGAAVALLLTLIALMVLVLLLYTTLNQMRPDRIIQSIHDLTLSARIAQRSLLARTRREPTLLSPPATCTVEAQTNGYLAGIDLDQIGDAIARVQGDAEVVLDVALGDYVCFHDVLAHVAAPTAVLARELGDETHAALSLERQRNFPRDPGLGVGQLTTVGWTSISTAKSNPAPGIAAVRNLRDLLVRWLDEPALAAEDGSDEPPIAVVYRDRVKDDIIDALESLVIVASESMQHQSAAEVYNAFAAMLPRLPAELQARVTDAVRRSLAALGDHVLARDLDQSLRAVASALIAAGQGDAATEVIEARDRLAACTGSLHSRGTRSGRTR